MNSEAQQEELNEEHEPEQPIESGPGHLLAKQREALGLSVQEVADALHITMHYVRALEADAHEKLPGDVFIKGYLRSYAGILQLDPTVIVNVYLDYSGERAHAEVTSTFRRINRRRIPWIVVSGVAFVGMAIILWLFSSGDADPSPSPARSTGNAAAVTTPNVTTRNLGSGVAASLDQVATTVEVPSVPDQFVPPETSPAPEEQAIPEIAPSEVPMPAELIPATEEILDHAEAITDSPTQDEFSSERLISVDGGGEDLVQFTFTGQSMVQVIDANDEQLYRDVRGAGDMLRISGTAPFNILLGDASNLELSFNGTKVDFSSSIRIDNTARLTIGL